MRGALLAICQLAWLDEATTPAPIPAARHAFLLDVVLSRKRFNRQVVDEAVTLRELRSQVLGELPVRHLACRA